MNNHLKTLSALHLDFWTFQSPNLGTLADGVLAAVYRRCVDPMMRTMYSVWLLG